MQTEKFICISGVAATNINHTAKFEIVFDPPVKKICRKSHAIKAPLKFPYGATRWTTRKTSILLYIFRKLPRMDRA